MDTKSLQIISCSRWYYYTSSHQFWSIMSMHYLRRKYEIETSWKTETNIQRCFNNSLSTMNRNVIIKTKFDELDSKNRE